MPPQRLTLTGALFFAGLCVTEWPKCFAFVSGGAEGSPPPRRDDYRFHRLIAMGQLERGPDAGRAGRR